MKSIILGKGRDRRIQAGHLWVYAGEIRSVDDGIEPGEVVEVRDYRRRFLGRGPYNPASLIRVRLLTLLPEEEIDLPFFQRRIREALAYREQVFPGEETLRLVSSEGDKLPGLVVDRYGPYLCLQVGTLGMEKLRPLFVEALQNCLRPSGIYERSDLSIRSYEGLEARQGEVAGTVPDVIPVQVDNLKFRIRVREGQKTGIYLDQRINRRTLLPLAENRTVLDAFCNTGGFGLYALRGGAAKVVGIDSSEACIERAREHAEINGFSERSEFQVGNAFDRLHALDREHKNFDIVVLDPPAFTKSSKNLEGARRGYKEINLRAMRILSPGGFLLTSSCSYHLSLEDFLDVLRSAAADSQRNLRLVSLGGQAPDHPVCPGVPETRYLKFALLYCS